MVFSSAFFLYIFFPLVLFGYYLTPAKLKNLFLVIVSIFFYAWGAPNFLIIFLASCVVDYALVCVLGIRKNSQARQKLIMTLSIIANVGLLLYFKYANFFIDQTNYLLSEFGFTAITWTKVVLPIGISFFTFHKLSYSVDVYRGKSQPTKNFIDYLLYISFFPQLIAGPIIRYHEIDTQILSRKHSLDNIYQGLFRFIVGLGKKVLLADPMAAVAEHTFNLPENHLTPYYAWVGLIAYSLQIYFDFSGYSDMAIGLAKVFGFTFPENFNKPYRSISITDFWRRWHMSLSRWMRDYLYIPLGGNRGSTFRTYTNLWIVFIISGFWHGAEWTFVLWGVYHGFFLVLERLGLEKLISHIPKIVCRIYGVGIACLGWVLFRSTSLSNAIYYYKTLFLQNQSKIDAILPPASIISNHGLVIMTIGMLFCLTIESDAFCNLRKRFSALEFSTLGTLTKQFGLIIIFLLCVLAIESSNFSPFIYFQF